MKYLFEYIPPVRSDVLGFYDVILRSKAYAQKAMQHCMAFCNDI